MLRFSATPARLCWELTATPGAALDSFLATAAMAGILVEPISPNARYRLIGDYRLLEGLAAQLAEHIEAWSLAIEQAPTDTIRFTSKLAPASPYRRTVFVHGVGDAFRQLRLAIDACLEVSTVGLCRWAITGKTAALVAWCAQAWGRSIPEMLTLWQLTPADVEAEDAPLGVTVPVTITLPDTRTTTTAIVRNPAGDIVRVDQKTVDVG